MKPKDKYYIGEMSQICDISRKTLRYYDEIGLIVSYRHDYNNYRYYTYDSLLTVPVLKYYKQMGFKLHEMISLIRGDVPNMYRVLRNSFTLKLQEIEQAQEGLQKKYRATKDWHDLISEAETVIDNNINEISIKYVEGLPLLYQEQLFDNDIKGAIINIDWTRYVEEMNTEITGPVILHFSSRKDRITGKKQTVWVMQNTIGSCPPEMTTTFGAGLMVCCYHIGSHQTIGETYARIDSWARNQPEYILGEDVYERYVTDYWTTSNEQQFVTEIMINVKRKGSEKGKG